MRIDKQISSERVDTWLARRGAGFPGLVLLVPMAGIVLSESLLFFGYQPYAEVGHTITVVFAAIATTWLVEEGVAFAALAFVSVTRLVTLGMPAVGEFTFFWLWLVYLPVLAGLAVLVSRNDQVDVRLDVVTGFQLLPLAIPLGVALAEMPFRYIDPRALITNWDSPFVVGLFVALMFVLAFVEEVVYRGLLQRALVFRFGWVMGILLASVLFALTRSGHGMAPVIFLAFGNGLLLGVLYDLTESLSFVAVVHGTLNVCLFGLFPHTGSFFS